MDMIDHNEEFYESLIKIAHESFNQSLAELEYLKDVENIEKLQKLAHKVKGTALNLGANHLAEVSSKVEKSNPENSKEQEKLIKKLRVEIEKLLTLL